MAGKGKQIQIYSSHQLFLIHKCFINLTRDLRPGLYYNTDGNCFLIETSQLQEEASHVGCDTFTSPPQINKTSAFVLKRAFSPLSHQQLKKNDVCLHRLARCSQQCGLSSEWLQRSADLQTSMKAFCEEESHFCQQPELPVLFRTSVKPTEVYSGL